MRITESERTMLTGYRTVEELTENLLDIGCSEDMVSCLLSCLERGGKAEGLRKLEEGRMELLCRIHRERASIGFLDELLSNLRRQPK